MLVIKQVELKSSKDARQFKVCKVGELPTTINSNEVITAIEEKTATIVIWATNKQGVANPSFPRAVVGGMLDAEKFSTQTASYTVVDKTGKTNVVSQFTGIKFANETQTVAMNRYGFVVSPNGEYSKKVATVATTPNAPTPSPVAANPVTEQLPA